VREERLENVAIILVHVDFDYCSASLVGRTGMVAPRVGRNRTPGEKPNPPARCEEERSGSDGSSTTAH